MGNEGSVLRDEGDETRGSSVDDLAKLPQLKPRDRRLSQLSALEQLLLAGPPPGVEFAFSLDDAVEEATAAQRNHECVRRAMDKLCQPGMLSEDLFWRNYFWLRRSGSMPTLADCLVESRATGVEPGGTLASFDVSDKGCAFLAEQALKDHPYLVRVRAGVASSSLQMGENEFWRRYFTLLEGDAEFAEMLAERRTCRTDGFQARERSVAAGSTGATSPGALFPRRPSTASQRPTVCHVQQIHPSLILSCKG